MQSIDWNRFIAMHTMVSHTTTTENTPNTELFFFAPCFDQIVQVFFFFHLIRQKKL